MAAQISDRKLRGAWYTPSELVDLVVERMLDGFCPTSHVVRVVDPACGDGRFLVAVGDRLRAAGVTAELHGCDIDPDAVRASAARGIAVVEADALRHAWQTGSFDLVVGNPPFLSQMAAATTRGGAGRGGAGPYADAAVEFLALATELARPDGGRVGLVLPQSILGARDAAPVRSAVAQRCRRTWSWWSPDQRHFDAGVNVCALGFERPGPDTGGTWTQIVTDRLEVPPLGEIASLGTLGDRADLNANFRDEYYALVPVVSDTADGPPLVTSGLIDAGRCHWGDRPVRFAKRDFSAPRVDVARLEGRFAAWAQRKLVPKVLIANQTRIIEAVADDAGAWLPGVPVSTATPFAGTSVWELAAVLTSPAATIAAWHHVAGTGLSPRTIRLGPATLGATPWPAGSDELAAAVVALRSGDVVGCGRAVTAAYGVPADRAEAIVGWWARQL